MSGLKRCSSYVRPCASQLPGSESAALNASAVDLADLADRSASRARAGAGEAASTQPAPGRARTCTERFALPPRLGFRVTRFEITQIDRQLRTTTAKRQREDRLDVRQHGAAWATRSTSAWQPSAATAAKCAPPSGSQAKAAHLYIFSEGDAGKVKRIRATKRVAVAACDVRGGLEGRLQPGRRTRRARTKQTIARGYRALRKKYGWQMVAARLLLPLVRQDPQPRAVGALGGLRSASSAAQMTTVNNSG